MSRAALAQSPRVSVLTATFNAAGFIETTLASALRQTFGDFELVVIDDGSSDGTVEVVARLMAADARIRLIRQMNRGPSATRNRAILESRGELIAFLDHDDLWLPDKLARQVALIDARPEVGVVSCYSAVIDARHRCLGWRLGGDANGNVADEMIEWDMVSGGSVALMRREALEQVGHLDETLRFREDWDLWIRLARHVRFATVPCTLVGYTRSPGSESRNYQQMALEGQRVLEKARRDDPRVTTQRLRFCQARDLFAMAVFCAIDGEVSAAWRFLRRSVATSPAPVLRSPKRWAFVGVLILQTILPPAAFARVFGLLNRMSFHLQPGQPFHQLADVQR
ncbi:MAG: glycosyltransferase [Acidobacteria bacterium]|nr:glycosyltransferase [Acidobacteriota bacterium]